MRLQQILLTELKRQRDLPGPFSHLLAPSGSGLREEGEKRKSPKSLNLNPSPSVGHSVERRLRQVPEKSHRRGASREQSCVFAVAHTDAPGSCKDK